MNINHLQKAVKAAMFTGAALAVALPAAYAADADDTVEEITVTGSRIKRDGFDSVSPVAVTSSEEIKVSGFTRIEDLLNTLPQIEAAQNAFISNGSSGTASLDLRGLGASRTLVLVNGRRLQPGGIYSQAPDINQIPAGLVERAEVLTGGASATYGADAVAGVVNFVMKDDFDGIEVTVGASGYQHNNDNGYIQGLMDDSGFDYPTGSSGIDGKAYNVDIAMGSDFADGKGHATVYATKRDNEELRQGSRDYSSCALNNAGTSCGGSFNAVVPNFILTVDPAFSDYDYWTLDTGGNGFDVAGGLGAFLDNPYNYAPVNHFQRPDTRYSLGTFVNYEVNEQFNPYLEVSYMNDRTKAQIAESGTFFNELYEIPLTSNLLSSLQQQQLMTRFGLTAADSIYTLIGKRNVEGGPRTDVLEHNSFRTVAGSSGALTDNWDYDASFQYGQTSSTSNYINDFFAPRITIALDDAECAATDGCIPYDVFTLNGVTSEQANTLTGTGVLSGVTSSQIFNAYVTGDTGFKLPGADSTVDMVFGVETRTETFERTADEVFEKGLLLGQGGTTSSIVGEYSVDEFFAETHIPVIEGNQELSIDLAFRYSDYSTSGGENTYKIGAEYSPIDKLRLRAGYNRAVRAPNVGELFSPQSTGLWNGTDPCAGTSPALTAAQCANTGVSAAQYGNISNSPASQYNGIFGGNPDLGVEIADTITFGAVIDPIDNMRISVDYWSIELEDVIGAIGAELTVEQCGLTGLAVFCDNVNRAAGTGSLWIGTGNGVTATNINLASREFEGIDLLGTYSFDALGGSFTNKIQGTFMLTKTFTPLPGVEGAAYDCVGDVSTDCFAQPEWRHTFATTYDRGGDWTATAKWRHYGKVHNYDGVDLIANDNLEEQNYLDLSGSYDVNENIAVLFGINNILDKEPPLVGGTLASNANAVAGFYDTLGRYLFGSVTFKY